MSATPNEKPNNTNWHAATHYFSVLSEACNAGILIDVVHAFEPDITTVFYGILGIFAHYADIGIYVFKVLIRLTKALGRHFFDIQFDDDVKQHSILQTTLDIITMIFFITTIVLLMAISGPIAPTLAWISALIGLCIIGYSDYYLTQKDCKKNLDEALNVLVTLTKDCLNKPFLVYCQEEEALNKKFKALENQYKLYTTKNKSYRLYLMLVAGLSALLICNSATSFVTGLTLSVMSITAKIASVYLGLLAMVRYYNYQKSKNINTTDNPELDFVHHLGENLTLTLNAQDLITKFAEKRNMELDFENCQAIRFN